MSIEWPEEVAKKIGLAIEGRIMRGGHAFPSTEDLGLAALDALGGERVWYSSGNGKPTASYICWRTKDEALGVVNPAILIKLERE